MSQPQEIRLPLPNGDAVPALSERMLRATEQTPDPSSRAQRRAAEYRPDLATAMGELHAAAVRLGDLDPQTSELVRLRCATWHNCRVCKSLRHVTGGKRVLDESTAAKVSAYEDSDLDDRQKVALRLADAYMTVPGHIDDGLSADIRRDFSDSQVTEMFNDVGIGYFLLRDPDPSRFLTAVAPTFEVHVNSPLNHHGFDNPNELAGTPTVVNLTYGLNLEFCRNSLLTFGFVTPVTGPRPFDYEALVLFNFRFGRSARRAVPPVTSG